VGYALASEELGRHCATTGLTFNMHVATSLLVGQIADDMDLSASHRADNHRRRTALWNGVIQNHEIHSQPFSEGAPGGKFATMARKVDGGYLVTGRKIFASLSGAANIHNIVCLSDADDELHLMGIPANGEGVTIEGDWDPLGMRGTDSRNLVMKDVFVPDENEWIPPGMFTQAAWRWPYFYMTLSFSYLGLMRGILDYTAAYLRGEHGTSARRDNQQKQHGWSQMNLIFDRAQALCYRVLLPSRCAAAVPCSALLLWNRRTATPDAAQPCSLGAWRSALTDLVASISTRRRTASTADASPRSPPHLG